MREFVEESLGPDGLKRSVVVATPADTSPPCAWPVAGERPYCRAFPRSGQKRFTADGLADAFCISATRDWSGCG